MPQESPTHNAADPKPTFQFTDPNVLQGASSPNLALRRCCIAWDRAFKRHLAEFGNTSGSHIFARGPAARAYCKVMPPLATLQSIGDFIICVAHGMLIEAIPEKLGGQLMCATRAALARLASVQKLTPTPQKPKTPPSSSQKPDPQTDDQQPKHLINNDLTDTQTSQPIDEVVIFCPKSPELMPEIKPNSPSLASILPVQCPTLPPAMPE